MVVLTCGYWCRNRRIIIAKITDAQFYACSYPSCCTWVLIKLFAIQRPPHINCTARWPALHWGGGPVIVYFAIATTCPCLSRKSRKKYLLDILFCILHFHYLVPLSFSLFLSRTLSSTFIVSHSVSSNKKRWGNKFWIIESLLYWKSIIFACFFVWWGGGGGSWWIYVCAL